MDKLGAKIDQICEETGINPGQTHVSVDLSNVYFWKTADQRRVHLPKLADQIADLGVGGVSVYTPVVEVADNKLASLIDWLVATFPRFVSRNRFLGLQGDELFDEVARTLNANLTNNVKKRMPYDLKNIATEIARAAKFRGQSELFKARGFEVVGRVETVHERRVADDKVVGAVLRRSGDLIDIARVDEVRRIVSMASSVRASITHALGGMDRLREANSNGVNIQLAALERTLHGLTDALAQFGLRLNDLGEVVEAAVDLKDVVVSRREKVIKCDLDPLITSNGLDPVRMASYKAEVTLSGDGDFDGYYRALQHSGRSVMAVSTKSSLNDNLRKLDGLVIHEADGDDIFEKASSPSFEGAA
ncbi:hypothetical protein IT412_00395 [Candidatus Peregrinibacteria bacterium]|nr:hypothetical protein [Candidatus Peregrinibacteria bacterium]